MSDGGAERHLCLCYCLLLQFSVRFMYIVVVARIRKGPQRIAVFCRTPEPKIPQVCNIHEVGEGVCAHGKTSPLYGYICDYGNVRNLLPLDMPGMPGMPDMPGMPCMLDGSTTFGFEIIVGEIVAKSPY